MVHVKFISFVWHNSPGYWTNLWKAVADVGLSNSDWMERRVFGVPEIEVKLIHKG